MTGHLTESRLHCPKAAEDVARGREGDTETRGHGDAAMRRVLGSPRPLSSSPRVFRLAGIRKHFGS